MNSVVIVLLFVFDIDFKDQPLLKYRPWSFEKFISYISINTGSAQLWLPLHTVHTALQCVHDLGLTNELVGLQLYCMVLVIPIFIYTTKSHVFDNFMIIINSQLI